MPDEPDLQHPRVALSTVLLITTAVACVAALWQDRETKTHLKRERDRLRRELDRDHAVFNWPPGGRLRSDLLYANPVGALHPQRYFRYRVLTPTGGVGVARLWVTRTDAAGETVESGAAVLPLQDGEAPLEIFIHREAAGDQWRYRLMSRSHQFSECIGPLPPWFNEDGSVAKVGLKLYPTGGPGLAAGKRKVLMDCSNLRDDATTTRVKLTIEWQ